MPQVFGNRDQVIDHLITVLAHHIERVDAHRIVGVRKIDQHDIVSLTGGKESAQSMHDIAVWLDEGKTRPSSLASAHSQRTHRLRQVLEERTFALAGAGDGQQVVTQTFLWQEDRYAMASMTGGANLPTIAECHFRRS
jgi:hypothetical protein